MATHAPANVRVLLRIRPMNMREQRIHGSSNKSQAISIDSNNRLTLTMGGSNSDIRSDRLSSSANVIENKVFNFDAVLGPRSSQADVYDNVKEIVDAVANGYNGTIVAYGQTGSGKTHTVFGSGGTDSPEAGLIHRSLRELFNSITVYKAQAIQDNMNNHENSMIMADKDDADDGESASPSIKFYTEASFIEIFNEKVYDLLSNDASSLESSLPVRENDGAVYVEGLSKVDVENTAEAEALLIQGLRNRHVAATAMNRTSSRSHAVFFLSVTSVSTSADGVKRVRKSRFTLVDLAGSERQKTTGTVGLRLKEATMINKSLLCLGHVINALADRDVGGKERHIPFRDSKLTFLLRDSWGGNSKTCLVATVSPSISSLGETLSTLNFAQRAKLIRNTAVLNENTTGGSVAALKAEVTQLRDELRVIKDQRSSFFVESHGNLSFSDNLNISDQSAIFEPSSDEMYTINGEDQYMKRYIDEKRLNDSLKRKVMEEKRVRKSKQARIDYLTKSRKVNCDDESEEIDAIISELDSLQRQLDHPSPLAIEWKTKHDRVMIQLKAIRSSICPDSAEARIMHLQKEKSELEEMIQRGSEEKTGYLGLQATVDTLQKEKLILKQQVGEIKSLLEDTSQEKMVLESKLTASTNEIDVLFEEIDRLEKSRTNSTSEGQHNENNNMASESETQIAELKAKIEMEQEEKIVLKQQIGESEAMQENSSHEKMILESKLAASKEEIDVLFEEIERLKNDRTNEKIVENLDLSSTLDVQPNENNNMPSEETEIQLAELEARINMEQEERILFQSQIQSLKEQCSHLTEQAFVSEEECYKYQEQNKKYVEEKSKEEQNDKVIERLTSEKKTVELQLESMIDLQKKYEEQNDEFKEQIDSNMNAIQDSQMKLDTTINLQTKYEKQIRELEENVICYGDVLNENRAINERNKQLQENVNLLKQNLKDISKPFAQQQTQIAVNEEQDEIRKLSYEVMEKISSSMIENLKNYALIDREKVECMHMKEAETESKMKALSDDNQRMLYKLALSKNDAMSCNKKLMHITKERNDVRTELETKNKTYEENKEIDIESYRVIEQRSNLMLENNDALKKKNLRLQSDLEVIKREYNAFIENGTKNEALETEYKVTVSDLQRKIVEATEQVSHLQDEKRIMLLEIEKVKSKEVEFELRVKALSDDNQRISNNLSSSKDEVMSCNKKLLHITKERNDVRTELETKNKTYEENKEIDIETYRGIEQRSNLMLEHNDALKKEILRLQSDLEVTKREYNAFIENGTKNEALETEYKVTVSDLQRKIVEATEHVSHLQDEKKIILLEIEKVKSKEVEFELRLKALSDDNQRISNNLSSSKDDVMSCNKKLLSITKERNDLRIEIEILHLEIIALKKARENDEIVQASSGIMEQTLVVLLEKYAVLREEINRLESVVEERKSDSQLEEQLGQLHEENMSLLHAKENIERMERKELETETTIKELLDDNQRYADKLTSTKNNILNVTKERDGVSVKLGLLQCEVVELHNGMENAEVMEKKLLIVFEDNHALKKEIVRLKSSVEIGEKKLGLLHEENLQKAENIESCQSAASIQEVEISNLKENVRQLGEEKVESMERKEMEFESNIKELMDDCQRYSEKLTLTKNNILSVTKERDDLRTIVESLQFEVSRLESEFKHMRNHNVDPNLQNTSLVKKEDGATQISYEDDSLDEAMFLPNNNQETESVSFKTPLKKAATFGISLENNQNSIVKETNKENVRPWLASSIKKRNIRSALKNVLSINDKRDCTPYKDTNIKQH